MAPGRAEQGSEPSRRPLPGSGPAKQRLLCSSPPADSKLGVHSSCVSQTGPPLNSRWPGWSPSWDGRGFWKLSPGCLAPGAPPSACPCTSLAPVPKNGLVGPPGAILEKPPGAAPARPDIREPSRRWQSGEGQEADGLTRRPGCEWSAGVSCSCRDQGPPAGQLRTTGMSSLPVLGPEV